MRPAALVTLPLLLAACTDELGQGDVPLDVVAVSEFRFGRVEDTVSPGFDLDATTDDACGIPDLTSPDGEPGVDNSFGGILPTIELAGGQAIEALIQAAINSGELLILLEATGWSVAESGTCIPLTVARAEGTPMVGGHDRILDFQTFRRDEDGPKSTTDCAEVQADGSLVAHGLEIDMPLQVFDEIFEVRLVRGTLRLEPLGEDGVHRAVLGGGISTADMKATVADFDGIGDTLPDLINGLLDTRGDLSFESDCDHMSVTTVLTGVPAFVEGHTTAPAAEATE